MDQAPSGSPLRYLPGADRRPAPGCPSSQQSYPRAPPLRPIVDRLPLERFAVCLCRCPFSVFRLRKAPSTDTSGAGGADFRTAIRRNQAQANRHRNLPVPAIDSAPNRVYFAFFVVRLTVLLADPSRLRGRDVRGCRRHVFRPSTVCARPESITDALRRRRTRTRSGAPHPLLFTTPAVHRTRRALTSEAAQAASHPRAPSGRRPASRSRHRATADPGRRGNPTRRADPSG